MEAAVKARRKDSEEKKEKGGKPLEQDNIFTLSNDQDQNFQNKFLSAKCLEAKSAVGPLIKKIVRTAIQRDHTMQHCA